MVHLKPGASQFFFFNASSVAAVSVVAFEAASSARIRSEALSLLR